MALCASSLLWLTNNSNGTDLLKDQKLHPSQLQTTLRWVEGIPLARISRFEQKQSEGRQRPWESETVCPLPSPLPPPLPKISRLNFFFLWNHNIAWGISIYRTTRCWNGSISSPNNWAGSRPLRLRASMLRRSRTTKTTPKTRNTDSPFLRLC